MGDVLEFRRTVKVAVRRFGSTFEAVLHAGPTPAESDPEVAIYCDRVFCAWAAAEWLTSRWEDLALDMPDDQAFVQPGMLGIPPSEYDVDTDYLMDTEDYVLTLLRDELARQLVAHYGAAEEAQLSTPARTPTPRERAMRILHLWHNHGHVEGHLVSLIAIEIAAAAEELGEAVASGLAVGLEEGGRPDDIIEAVRGLVAGKLGQWEREDELHVQ